MQQASHRKGDSLSQEEADRLKNVETGRFFQGGRGRSGFSDQYVLCFLNHGYQLLEIQATWLPESKCEDLRKYVDAGIEMERLKDICASHQYQDEHCDVCNEQSSAR